jgi:hypothetical protein
LLSNPPLSSAGGPAQDSASAPPPLRCLHPLLQAEMKEAFALFGERAGQGPCRAHLPRAAPLPATDAAPRYLTRLLY